MLKINDVSFSFDKKKEILKKINISVADGEFVSILGPSGSGKSTLFHLIGGLLLPSSGTIELDGKVVNGQKGNISYMPQQPALLPWRTILQNVLLGAELTIGVNEQKARELLAKAGLAEYEKALPSELSGGMKQRVAFIRSLASPGALMCLDEPFSALDEFTRLSMQKWLINVWEEDKRSVLFITHSIEEALFLSDKIYVLSNKPAEVIKELRVPFSRPRREELLISEELFHLKQELYGMLKETSR